MTGTGFWNSDEGVLEAESVAHEECRLTAIMRKAPSAGLPSAHKVQGLSA